MSRSTMYVVVVSACLIGCSTMTLAQEKDKERSSLAVPNDSLFAEQYYFDRMDVLEAWAITTGSKEVVIGVAERGFDSTHEEFQTGRIEVYRLSGMEHPHDWLHENHGTEVVGLIAAESNNGKGYAGLAPGCNVIVAQIGTHESFRKKTPESAKEWNRLFSEKSSEAIRYLVDRDCKVIDCSFTILTSIADALEYAIAHDVLLVVPSGNSNRNSPQFPAGTLDVLSVGGVDKNDDRWVNAPIKLRGKEFIQGSNYGKGLNVVAPCRDLAVCMPFDETTAAQFPKTGWLMTNFGLARRGGYLLKQNKGGTSLASPMATALAALIRSLRPDLTFREVIKIIEQGADDLDEEGWDQYTGYGRINFHHSLKIAETWPTDK